MHYRTTLLRPSFLALPIALLLSGMALAQPAPGTQHRMEGALLDICPRVASEGADLNLLATSSGGVEGRMPNARIRREGGERSFTYTDAPGLHLMIYEGACGIVMLAGDPVANGEAATAIVVGNRERFPGGVVVGTMTQQSVPGNAAAAFGMQLRGDDYRTAAYRWMQTVNTRDPPGRHMIMTINYDRARAQTPPR